MLLSNTFFKEWKHNTAIGAETIVLLDLLEVMERKGRHTTSAKIKIGFDNRIACRKIVSKIAKASMLSQDSIAEIAKIQEILSKI